MSFKSLFTGLLILQFPILLLGLFLTGGTAVFNLGTLFIVYIMLGLMLAMLYTPASSQSPFTYITIMAIHLWIMLRLHTVLLFPSKLNYTYILAIHTKEMNFTLIGITLGILAIYVGIIIANTLYTSIYKSPPSEANAPSTLLQNYPVFIFIGYICLSVGFLSYTLLGQARGGGSKIVAVINYMFSYEFSTLTIFIVTILFWKKLTTTQKITFWIFLLIFLLFRTFTGSKGAFFLVAIWLFSICVALIKKPGIKKHYLVLSVLMAPLAIAAFLYGYLMRIAGQVLKGESVSLLDMFKQVQHLNVGLDPMVLLDMISRRISMLDYCIVLFNTRIESHYLSFVHSLKNVCNTLFPGTPFIEAKYAAARLFKVSYDVQDYSSITQNYHTDMLPLFGHLYTQVNLIGMFLGIIAFTLLFSFTFSFFRSRPFMFWPFICPYLLLSFHDFLFGMGVDSSLQQYLLITPLQIVCFIALFCGIKSALNILTPPNTLKS